MASGLTSRSADGAHGDHTLPCSYTSSGGVDKCPGDLSGGSFLHPGSVFDGPGAPKRLPLAEND